MDAKALLRRGAALCAAVLISTASFQIGRRASLASVRQAEAGETRSEAARRDPVEAYKAERQRLVAQQFAQLSDIIHDARSDAAIIERAEREILAMQEAQRQAVTIECVLEARGFECAVATVRPDSVNVILRGEAPVTEQAAVILELVTRETGADSKNVKIIPVK